MLVHERDSGKHQDDITSFHPDQKGWGEDRSCRPNILFQFEAPQNYKDQKQEVGNMMYGDKIVLDPDNRPVRNFQEIPLTVSSKVEGWLMEAIRRQNHQITPSDFRARMPRDPSASNLRDSAGNWTGPGDDPLCTPGALDMRMTRWRAKHRCIAWTKKAGSEELKADLWGKMTDAQKNANSTEGMQDADNQELQSIQAINKGKYMQRSRNKKAETTSGTLGGAQGQNQPEGDQSRVEDPRSNKTLPAAVEPKATTRKRGLDAESTAEEISEVGLDSNQPMSKRTRYIHQTTEEPVNEESVSNYPTLKRGRNNEEALEEDGGRDSDQSQPARKRSRNMPEVPQETRSGRKNKQSQSRAKSGGMPQTTLIGNRSGLHGHSTGSVEYGNNAFSLPSPTYGFPASSFIPAVPQYEGSQMVGVAGGWTAANGPELYIPASRMHSHNMQSNVSTLSFEHPQYFHVGNNHYLDQFGNVVTAVRHAGGPVGWAGPSPVPITSNGHTASPFGLQQPLYINNPHIPPGQWMSGLNITGGEQGHGGQSHGRGSHMGADHLGHSASPVCFPDPFLGFHWDSPNQVEHPGNRNHPNMPFAQLSGLDEGSSNTTFENGVSFGGQHTPTHDSGEGWMVNTIGENGGLSSSGSGDPNYSNDFSKLNNNSELVGEFNQSGNINPGGDLDLGGGDLSLGGCDLNLGGGDLNLGDDLKLGGDNFGLGGDLSLDGDFDWNSDFDLSGDFNLDTHFNMNNDLNLGEGDLLVEGSGRGNTVAEKGIALQPSLHQPQNNSSVSTSDATNLSEVDSFNIMFPPSSPLEPVLEQGSGSKDDISWHLGASGMEGRNDQQLQATEIEDNSNGACDESTGVHDYYGEAAHGPEEIIQALGTDELEAMGSQHLQEVGHQAITSSTAPEEQLVENYSILAEIETEVCQGPNAQEAETEANVEHDPLFWDVRFEAATNFDLDEMEIPRMRTPEPTSSSKNKASDTAPVLDEDDLDSLFEEPTDTGISGESAGSLSVSDEDDLDSLFDEKTDTTGPSEESAESLSVVDEELESFLGTHLKSTGIGGESAESWSAWDNNTTLQDYDWDDPATLAALTEMSDGKDYLDPLGFDPMYLHRMR